MTIDLHKARTKPETIWFVTLTPYNIEEFGKHLGFDKVEAQWAVGEIVVSFSSSTDDAKHEDLLHVPLNSYMYTFNGVDWMWLRMEDFRKKVEQVRDAIEKGESNE